MAMELHLANDWLALERAIGYRPRMSGDTVLEIRNALRLMTKGAQNDAQRGPNLTTYDTVTNSSPPIKVRVYEPKPDTDERPTSDVALFFHGGGWCIGDLDLEDDLVAFMATQTGIKFVSVDYRLAPEHPWPAQLEDCNNAVQWVIQNFLQPEHKPIDSSGRLILVGTSAGGHLALSVAAELSSSPFPVHGVVALAPFTIRKEDAIEHINEEVASYSENADAPILSPEVLEMFLDATHAPIGDPVFSILLSPHLSAMPPTYIVTCGADILRDHGLLFKEKLKQKGIPVKADNYAGYPHTFWATPGLAVVDKFRSNLINGIEFVQNASDTVRKARLP